MPMFTAINKLSRAALRALATWSEAPPEIRALAASRLRELCS